VDSRGNKLVFSDTSGRAGRGAVLLRALLSCVMIGMGALLLALALVLASALRLVSISRLLLVGLGRRIK
jgi:hypothetical protein